MMSKKRARDTQCFKDYQGVRHRIDRDRQLEGRKKIGFILMWRDFLAPHL